MYGKTPYMGLSIFHPSKNHSKNTKNRSYFFVIQENNRIFALKFIETLRK